MIYKIGKIIHGGIIFSIDETGEHGLVIAEKETLDSFWEEAKEHCSQLKLNYYEDWYLPSKDELFLAYHNLHKQGIGDFANYGHWSSTENNDGNSLIFIDFGSGLEYDGRYRRGDKLLVRAVRAF